MSEQSEKESRDEAMQRGRPMALRVTGGDQIESKTRILKSDHRLNMSLGTDIKFTLSFLSAESLCC